MNGQNASTPPNVRDRWVARWLFAVAGLVVIMIVVGGLTRLTDSGLSITEWKPVTGAVPPLSEAAWEAEFAKYREIPEYQLQNRGMSLAEFKTIYWWEWGHRLLGRFIGVAFLVPLLVFWVRGWIRPWMRGRLAGLFLLGGLQGAVGWWMVASGLSERVDVSQYRLAAHLGVAFVLLGALWWTAFDARRGERVSARWSHGAWVALGFAAAVFVQIIAGAFVAGLDAGRVYTDWPLMQGALVPDAYAALEPFWRNAFENRAAVQFNHRILGYALVAVGVWVAADGALGGSERVRTAALTAGGLTVAQAVLGIVTLVAAAPLVLSALHQLTAAALFLAALSYVRARAFSLDSARRS